MNVLLSLYAVLAVLVAVIIWQVGIIWQVQFAREFGAVLAMLGFLIRVLISFHQEQGATA